MASDGKLALLRAAESGFVATPPPPRLPLVNGEVPAWLARHGIVYHSSFSMVDGSASGFNADGANAIFALADELLSEHPKMRGGTRRHTLAYALANNLHRNLPRTTSAQAAESDLIAVEAATTDWFLSEAVPRTFLIPCSIIPEHASPVSVGPVRFCSIWDLASKKGKDVSQLQDDIEYGSLIDMMVRGASHWLAEVQIDGCDEKVGTERANLAVDIALVAVQFPFPLDYSRQISRSTSRRMPFVIGSFFWSGSHMSSGFARQDPGLGISVVAFDQVLVSASQLLESVGRRVDSYVSGAGRFPKLERGWCDAAYWLHEGWAEPLDTVAIAKLETAVEVLFSAESSKGSEARFRAAFKAFYGLGEEDRIRPSEPRTVKQFIKSIVGARSRILHGTAPTLTPYTPEMELPSRAVVELLCADFIKRSAVLLDEYAKDSAAVDDTEEFLAWIERHRLITP